MSLTEIAHQQEGWFTSWFVFRQPLGALIFFIAATAEANRTPFDLTEADSEIVAGFATEYSGMRFGFLFFAEYVNVFIVSALMVTLFFGSWNAPVNVNDILNQLHIAPITVDLDPGSLGVGLLLLVMAVPVALTLLFGLPFYLTRSRMPAWQAVVIGFVLFNVVAMGIAFLLAYIGLVWLHQVLHVRLRVRLDARHLPARPHRSPDGLRVEVAPARRAPQPVPDGHGDRRGQGPPPVSVR